MAEKEFEVAIVGGGPAGLAAGLYAARARRSTVLIERKGPGGQISTTDIVENYPGFPEGVDGFELGIKMHEQASKYGMETEYVELNALEREPDGRYRLRTSENDIVAKAVILTAGADYNHLNIPNEERLTGKGVSYCATCDAAFFRDVVVAVVGGGDSAMEEALFLTRYASKVYVIHRRDDLRASKIMQERALNEPKIEFIWNTVVDEVLGDQKVDAIRMHDVKTGEERTLALDGFFVAIGQTPNNEFIDGLLKLDEGGHIPVNEWMETEAPGVFAAGDLRWRSARQVISAAGDGATAAIAADRYITDHFE